MFMLTATTRGHKRFIESKLHKQYGFLWQAIGLQNFSHVTDCVCVCMRECVEIMC